MKKCNAIYILLLILTMPAGESFGEESQRVFKETFSPRHLDSVCPPDYQTTREDLEFYLESPHRKVHSARRVGGVDLEELSEDYDIELPTIADFKILRDRDDSAICQRLNERYGEQIATMIQLFDGGEPEYLYDISYYKGAGFHAVVLAGGVLIQHDPLNPDREAYYAAPFGAHVVLFDEALNVILDRFSREAKARLNNQTD